MMSGRVWAALISCNVIWSLHPTMSKLVMQSFPAPQAAWLRYTSAWVAYVAGMAVLRSLRIRRMGQPFMVPQGASRTKDLALLCLLGFAAFCFSPLLQFSGLQASHAVDNALIVAMEPLMTVFLAWMLLGERPGRATVIAFAVSLVGFALLTGISPAMLMGSAASAGGGSHWVGNLVLLISLWGEATYSLAGRKLVARYAPASIFGSALSVGVIFLTVFTVVMTGLPSIQSVLGMSWASALGILWIGPLGTGVSYLIWMVALTQAPVASLALTLFIQPLLGPVWGVLLLGESFGGSQVLGSLLILAAVVGQTWVELRKRRAANPESFRQPPGI